MNNLAAISHAFNNELHRWGSRHDKSSEKPFQVFRFDDTGMGGSFSELHSFSSEVEMDQFFERMISEKPAKAVTRHLISVGWTPPTPESN